MIAKRNGELPAGISSPQVERARFAKEQTDFHTELIGIRITRRVTAGSTGFQKHPVVHY